ncbi:MAG: sulfotransferase domain-containing protein [Phycisphaeraceae bacterium]|nr:sulfotransferase domain-containing protein [Phycisphaeraceae bacterium]
MTTSPRLPDFLIIGAAKCGTTTLYRYLCRHPNVFMPADKEPCFFDSRINFPGGLAGYQSLFAEARSDQLIGEASTNYTFWPHVPDAVERIAELIPRAKLIYIMRHPVDRAYSHYVHRFTKELYPGQPFHLSFEQFVEIDPMCIDTSRYARQIERYLTKFERSSLLLLTMDDLIRDPASLVKKTVAFLGLDPTVNLMGGGPIKDNEGTSQREGKLRYYATGPFRRNPVTRLLAYALGKSFRNWAYSRLSRSFYGKQMREAYTPIPMQPQTRAKLIEEFRRSNEQVARMLGVDLSHWNR